MRDNICRHGIVLSKHAEENVLERYLNSKYRNIYKPHQLTLVVVRINNGSLVDSKPCSHCVEVMRKLGIGKVIYSSTDGSLIKESLSSITPLSSTGYGSANRIVTELNRIIDYYSGNKNVRIKRKNRPIRR